MLQIFQLVGPQQVVMAHDLCDLVIALAACRGAEQIVESAPALLTQRADTYSDPRNESDRQVAPGCPLTSFERKGDGLARCCVE